MTPFRPSAQDRSGPLVASSGRSPLTFIALVFVLAVPFWLVGAVSGLRLSPDLPVSALMAVCPAIAAAILARRENGSAGVTALLRRSFDYGRIRTRRWYVPVILLMPVIHVLAYWMMQVMGLPLPTPRLPLLATLAMLLAFFLSGLGEELGWSGYATEPLQDRWGALGAGIILGLVWAAWHYVPLMQVHRAPAWIAWWSLGTVAQRVLIVWIYDNSGGSVFAAALVHTLANMSQLGPFLDFGPEGYPCEALRILSLILAAAAVIVTTIWGPRTLARSVHP